MASLGTLAGMIAEGATVTAYCACGHSSHIDLEALAARLGGDFSIQDNRSRFISRLRCTACRGTCNTIILSPGYSTSVDDRFRSGQYRYGTGAASF